MAVQKYNITWLLRGPMAENRNQEEGNSGAVNKADKNPQQLIFT